jgi:tetratricopeptide (TPR) repeat protein
VRLFRRVLVIVLVLFSSALWAEDQWREVNTAHFSLVTDASGKQTIEIATRLEQLRAVFATLMSQAKTSDPAPLHIIALRDTRELKDVLRPSGGASTHSGLFKSGADENLIVIDLSETDPWHAVLHEYAHELLNSNTEPNTETWFDEGFAEYFSTIAIRRGFADVGLVPIPDLHFLRENGKLLQLEQLFSIDPGSAIYATNGEYQSIFYAESWLLVHYLFEHALINKTKTFFATMERTHNPDAAACEAFGMSLKELERQVLIYGKGDSFRYFRLPFVHDLGTARWKMRLLQELEREAISIDVEEHFGRSLDFVIAEYQRLLSVSPENELALRGIGSALLGKGDVLDASQHLRRALAINPRDAEAHYFLALSESQFAIEHGGVGPGNVLQEANACIALEPTFAGCYRLLALGYASKGENVQAMLNMNRAIALSPRTESYALDLAEIKLHSGPNESASTSK